MLVQINYANLINIAAKEEIIPELLQSNCNSKNIFNLVSNFLETPSKMQEQVKKTQLILSQFKTEKSSSELASKALNRFLKLV